MAKQQVPKVWRTWKDVPPDVARAVLQVMAFVEDSHVREDDSLSVYASNLGVDSSSLKKAVALAREKLAIDYMEP